VAAAAVVEVKRCPYCLSPHRIPKDAGDSIYQCVACRRGFAASSALPTREKVGDEAVPHAVPEGRYGWTKWLAAGVAVVVAVSGLTAFGDSMNGPAFLPFYALLMFATLLGVYAVRVTLPKTHTVWMTAIALMIFESTGVMRFILGSDRGMHRFEFLAGIMLGGGLMILFAGLGRIARSSYGGSSNSGCGGGGGGCGGASGGGSGCGGGCGGCGD